MSSSAKTEKPSDKKKRDESKKGKSWRSQDLVSLIILFGGACFLRFGLSMDDPMRIMLAAAERGFTTPLDDYAISFVQKFLGMIAGLLGLVFFLAAVPNLLMSRFRFASQVIKLNFGAINPIAGIKKIFALKNLKDGIKASLYLCAFAVVGIVFWEGNRADILALTHAAPRHLLRVLADLGFTLILSLLGTALFLALLDAFLEYVLYIKELKMTREEVKREHKDQNGAPEVKQEQRRLGHELLSGEMMGNVEQSSFVLANPTHIAIGVYINTAIAPLPFISVMETNERALAVIEHAKKMNIPVIQNIPVARKMFKTCKRYSFVAEDCLNDIADVLTWLVDVEKSRQGEYLSEGDAAGDAENEADAAATGEGENEDHPSPAEQHVAQGS